MNVFLWVLQGVLATMYLVSGSMKVSKPKSELEKQLPWVEDFSSGTVKLIGAAEFAGAVGLVVPALTGIAVVLTPLAATGLAVTMFLALLAHVRRREPGAVVFTAALMLAAAVVAWGRFGPYAF